MRDLELCLEHVVGWRLFSGVCMFFLMMVLGLGAPEAKVARYKGDKWKICSHASQPFLFSDAKESYQACRQRYENCRYDRANCTTKDCEKVQRQCNGLQSRQQSNYRQPSRAKNEWTGVWAVCNPNDRFNQYPVGEGKFTYGADGSTFEGEMACGTKVKGILVRPSGVTAEGEWALGPNKTNYLYKGKIKESSGRTMEGIFNYKQTLTEGTMVLPNGAIVTGTFDINGIKEGSVEVPGKGKYEGTFKDSKPNTGAGVIVYEEPPALYKGKVKDGLYEGPGTLTFENGRTIVGEWSAGGGSMLTETIPEDDETYVGGIKGPFPFLRHGTESTLTTTKGASFTGEFKDGEMLNGKGTKFIAGDEYRYVMSNGKEIEVEKVGLFSCATAPKPTGKWLFLSMLFVLFRRARPAV